MLLIFYTNAFPQVSTDSSVDRALGIRMKAQGFEPAPHPPVPERMGGNG